MKAKVRVLALLGMVWAFGLALLECLLSISHGGHDLRFLGMVALLFLTCWRLYHLRRWAGVVVCSYCAWVAVTSPESGIWIWTCGWFLTALAATGLIIAAWRELRAGF